jgi:serine/threonine protein kinase
VWKACRDGDDVHAFALKVINTSNATREPYLRFVHEIETLRHVGPVKGVLPLVDSCLPSTPSKSNRPWLAMPIANEMEQALAGRSLDDIVLAVATVADTLEVLRRDHGIAHRDLKPGNLYELNGEWLVGDFGLVHEPDGPDLTASDRPVGSRHYAPYEMSADAANADPYSVDVYSLGKTLWVLATGQRYPPEGHQIPEQSRKFTIADFQTHPRTSALDALVERMTRINPVQRPTMAEIARDLHAWLAAPTDQLPETPSTLMERLKMGLDKELSERDIREIQLESARAAVRYAQEQFRPLNARLLDLRRDAEIDREDDEMARNILKADVPMRASIFRWVRASRLYSKPSGYIPYVVRIARNIELMDDAVLHFAWFVHAGLDGVSGSDLIKQGEGSCNVESLEVHAMIDREMVALAECVNEGLEVFAQYLERFGERDTAG